MTEMATSQARIRPETAFFFWMAVALLLVIYGGFGLSYWVPMATGTLRPLAPVVHFHGLFYFAWMALLVAQTMFISRGNVALHRSMGLAGIMVATGLVIFGGIVTILATQAAIENPDTPDFTYPLMWLSVFALVNFAALFTMAIRNVRDGATHKRYITLATIAFIGAGVNRYVSLVLDIPPGEFSPFWILYLITDLSVAALVIHDLRSLGRVHAATIVGGGLIVVTQAVEPLVSMSEWWVGATHWMAALAG